VASGRELITFGVAGVLIAALLIGVVTVGPSLILPAKAEGTLVIRVTDAPIQDLQSLNITVDSFEAHQKETDQWINVAVVEGQKTFDLVQLRNNLSQVAAIDQLPLGNYTKIRMHIVSAVAQVDGGSPFDVQFPPNKLDIIVHFDIQADKTTTLIIDIQVDTVKIAANPQHNVVPVMKATVVPPS